MNCVKTIHIYLLTKSFNFSTECESGNPEPPFFVERFEEQNVPQRGTIKLTAAVSGNPVPEIVWLQNNKPLLPSDRVKLSYDGENIEMVILEANSATDSGDYKCVASNPLGKVSHGARVIVEVDDVIFTKKLKQTIAIEESQTLTLECETSHYVSTKWYHNDKELTGMDHRVVVQQDKVHKLIIKDTAIRDAGAYKCTIKGHETKTTIEVLERKPEFVRFLQDYEAKELESAILEVELSTENAEIVWLKDSEELKEIKNKIKFVKEGKIRKLIIRSTSVHDEGEYTCVLNDQECSAEVTVIELPPQIITKLIDVTIAKGEKATFNIELTKGDALVKWYKDGEELQFSSHVQLSIDGKKQKLKIYTTTTEDAGEYSCEVGEQISAAVLTVEEPAADFVVRLPDVTLVTKTKDAEFTVKLSQPDVEVTWFKNGKPIKPSTKYTISVEGTVHRLVVHKANDDDTDEYSCVAGNVRTASNLKVEGK